MDEGYRWSFQTLKSLPWACTVSVYNMADLDKITQGQQEGQF